MLNENLKELILKLQTQYPEKRSALIPSLHIAQSQIGYLPIEIQNEVAALFEITPNEVHSVVTFYDMFHEKPTGKHIIHVCKNLSCMLRGSDPLLIKLCEKLNVQPGGTTADGEFTVIPSECLAACDRAPMMLVDDQIVGPVKNSDLDAILDLARKKTGHDCPVPLQGGESCQK